MSPATRRCRPPPGGCAARRWPAATWAARCTRTCWAMRRMTSWQAPELAAFYPSAGGTADPGPAGARSWAALRRLLADQGEAVSAWLGRPPQTNEVGRSAALLGGLRQLA